MKDGASFNMMYGYPFDGEVRLMNMKRAFLEVPKSSHLRISYFVMIMMCMVV